MADDGGGRQWTCADTSQQLTVEMRNRDRLWRFPDKEAVGIAISDTAILSSHPHARQAARFDCEQGRADSLHPGGLAAF